ncbi:hypothetical protein SAMN05444858_116112 [Micromonospora avicenniae]|uniref:Uncharacterized protein n=1 Tax=Micromonospora avicenniae TaxID=1198245 RepID=A0A1N7DGG1_9ACTN|nr:hypothetical protein SAMN05444858_116112 [Micromonospora avicenniae]
MIEVCHLTKRCAPRSVTGCMRRTGSGEPTMLRPLPIPELGQPRDAEEASE